MSGALPFWLACLTIAAEGAHHCPPTIADHHVWTEGQTLVQLQGIRPWGIDYVNPAEDPRNRKD